MVEFEDADCFQNDSTVHDIDTNKVNITTHPILYYIKRSDWSWKRFAFLYDNKNQGNVISEKDSGVFHI